jgi:hypothetical protein
MFVTGCAGDPNPTPRPTPLSTPTPIRFSLDPSWLDEFLASDPPVAPPATLSAADIDRIFASIGSPEAVTIADELHAIDPSWTVRSMDLDRFASDVCHTNARLATATLIAKLPHAKLNALAPLNEAVGLVYRTCTVTNPEVLTAVSDQIVLALMSEHQQTGAAIPTPVPDAVKPPSNFDKASCGAGAAVVGGLVKNYVKGLKGGIFAAAAIAAAAAYCPGVVGSALGQ